MDVPADPHAAFAAGRDIGHKEGHDLGVADTLAMVEAVSAVAVSVMPPPGRRITMPELAQRLASIDPAHLAVLRPYAVAETLTVKQAARLAGFAPRTIAQWTEKHRLGRLVGGSLRLSRPALLAFLDDDALALAAILSGRRDHPAARPYFERAGLSCSVLGSKHI